MTSGPGTPIVLHLVTNRVGVDYIAERGDLVFEVTGQPGGAWQVRVIFPGDKSEVMPETYATLDAVRGACVMFSTMYVNAQNAALAGKSVSEYTWAQTQQEKNVTTIRALAAQIGTFSNTLADESEDYNDAEIEAVNLLVQAMTRFIVAARLQTNVNNVDGAIEAGVDAMQDDWASMSVDRGVKMVLRDFIDAGMCIELD